MPTTDAGTNLREHILDSALALMAEHGAVGMSMRQLASCVWACRWPRSTTTSRRRMRCSPRWWPSGSTGRGWRTPCRSIPTAPAAERLRQLFHARSGTAPSPRRRSGGSCSSRASGVSRRCSRSGQDLLSLLYPACTAWMEQFLPEIDDADGRWASCWSDSCWPGSSGASSQPDIDPALIAEPLIERWHGAVPVPSSAEETDRSRQEDRSGQEGCHPVLGPTDDRLAVLHQHRALQQLGMLGQDIGHLVGRRHVGVGQAVVWRTWRRGGPGPSPGPRAGRSAPRSRRGSVVRP